MTYILLFLIGCFGFGLCIYSLIMLKRMKSINKKVTAYAKESVEEIISLTKFIDNSSFAKKHNLTTSSKYYKTLYRYTDNFGEEKVFYDKEITEYQVPEGTKKEFSILETTENQQIINEKTLYKYLKTGGFYILLSVISFIIQILL